VSIVGEKSRERPLMAGAVALASTGYIAVDRQKAGGGHGRLGPGVQVPHKREPALPTETAREQQYARRKVESSFWKAGAGSQPSCGPAGQAVMSANGTL